MLYDDATANVYYTSTLYILYIIMCTRVGNIQAEYDDNEKPTEKHGKNERRQKERKTKTHSAP